MTSTLRSHPIDPRVRISNDLAHLNQLVPGQTKMVEIENSVPEELQAIAADMSLEQKQSLCKAWLSLTTVVFEPYSLEPIHIDFRNGDLIRKLQKITPDAIYQDIMNMCREHRRHYGSSYLDINFLGCVPHKAANFAYHFDTNVDSPKPVIRLARVYNGAASEWLPVGRDLPQEVYRDYYEQTCGNEYKTAFNSSGQALPQTAIQPYSTAAWTGKSKELADPNLGFYHRRVQNVLGRVVAVIDNMENMGINFMLRENAPHYLNTQPSEPSTSN